MKHISGRIMRFPEINPHTCLALSSIAIIILVAMLHYIALPKLYQKDFREGTPFPGLIVSTPILLPDLEAHYTAPVDNFPFVRTFRLDYQPFQQTEFQIFTIGCLQEITINAKSVPFDTREQCQTMDPYISTTLSALTVDFAHFLKQGTNTLSIRTNGNGLQIGPVLFASGSWLLIGIGVCLVIAMCIWLILFMRMISGEWGSGLILSAGMSMYIFFLSHTTFMQYEVTPVAHLEYIVFIATHGYLPATHSGWEMYQAPLYYAIQALLLQFANWLGSFDTVSVLRVFSLCCFIAFLLFSSLLLQRLIHNKIAYYTSLSILAFYPSGIFLASRLNSDLLFYALYAGCLYFILRWMEEGRGKHLALALAMLGLGMATRTNSIILFPIIGLAALYQLRKRGRTAFGLRSAALWMGVAIVLLGVGVNAGRTMAHSSKGEGGPLLVANANQLPVEFAISNSIGKFLFLDARTYFSIPYWSIWNDYAGRQYFWNSLLKSSLFDRFEWNRPWLALAIGDLLMMLILYASISIAGDYRYFVRQRTWWFLIIALFVPILSMMAFRLLYPFSTSQEFRYIYPVTAGFSGILGMVMERHLEKKRIMAVAAGGLCSIAFINASVWFYLLQ